MADNSLKAGTLFKPELVKELISKVQGKSVLAKLSAQTPIPFNGTEQFIFNLEGNAQIVGEGAQKGAGKATLTSKVIKPIKFVYQARITDEFKYASEEKQIQYLKSFSDGFAKKIAEAFDIAALHGLEPKSMSDASFRATNSFDGQITANVVTYAEATFDDNIEAAVQQVTAKGGEVTGIALSPVGGQALAKIKDTNKNPLYPEFRFGQNPNSFYGMASDINKNLTVTGGTAETDHAIVGDFQNMFKWGYAENIPLEIIEYGDPDDAGRDLKAYNEICLRAEAFIGWGILDTEAFARVKATD
ncbi:phage major capsid protein [Enterococcus cecorum]|uniref:HK97 family phage major capsid protein n=1 Tax=Enterococcus cecorum DSM 20682 = ATCC 43198 TaxID=1121864 RepID=S1QWP5_9ENTE|nr:phage major capsid protein [Enterococcus cecorum]EOX17323.1 HK97 family phage major capsid protein [Enterococcus cecorum DSM 20682 = ATCC 43198]ESK60493.1 HK97 family phage major capsid protein [Enterococcus cecorum DSM 20682 = ATCC 43198]KLO71318.1 HK97 family phage major capsid protein [Enterococcus cecorum]MDZ5589952.1 phage major capsid protein [Enterococcus cecorum]OJG31478.1 HK97 family phage major capsid protein [Enterococcus cecorum DSM 20682 = ATCC 43198]